MKDCDNQKRVEEREREGSRGKNRTNLIPGANVMEKLAVEDQIG